MYELGGFLRVQKLITSFMGPEFTPTLDKIGLDITYLCNLRCAGCHKVIHLASSHESMSLGQVKKFIDERIDRTPFSVQADIRI